MVLFSEFCFSRHFEQGGYSRRVKERGKDEEDIPSLMRFDMAKLINEKYWEFLSVLIW